jgi:hypothetical protein
MWEEPANIEILRDDESGGTSSASTWRPALVLIRAGYLMEKMRLPAGARPQWLSTHPSGPSRIKDIERTLPRVMPIYAKATEREVSALPTHSVPD